MPWRWRWTSTTICAARLAREVHAVQNARKQAGLEILDRIELRLGGDGLVDAARPRGLRGRRDARELDRVRGRREPGAPAKIEGRRLVIAVSRSG